MEEFKKYYKFPLSIDEYCGNVIAQENEKTGYTQAWDWIENEWICDYPIDGNRGEQLADAIVKRVNGETDYYPDYKWTENSDDPCVIDMNGQPCIEIRGWGMLTGIGAYHLDRKKAAEIQDEFKAYIIKHLNKDYDLEQ